MPVFQSLVTEELKEETKKIARTGSTTCEYAKSRLRRRLGAAPVEGIRVASAAISTEIVARLQTESRCTIF